ncbi:MAG: ROK family protein [Lentisphaerae bacterium]|nr:ROK family protein [Lentisphaerota bacterium]
MGLNSRHGFVVGIEFDLYWMTAAVVDVCGRIVARRRIEMPCLPTRSAITEALLEAIASAIRESGYEPKALKGIGVADPGVVDTQSGTTRLCSLLPDWHDVPVRDLLTSRFGVPVLLDENTRAKTLCEHRAGAAQGIRHLLYVDVGSGIGCGLIMDGRLYRGHREIAGELGHVRVLENGPVCQCGGSGCLETVASYPALIRQARAALRDGARSLMAGRADALTMADFFEAVRGGDRLALGLWDRALRYLGEAVANAANLLNPELIAMNFNLPEADESLWLAALRGIVERRVIRLPGQDLPVRAARAGGDAGAWGAAMLLLDRLFEGPLVSQEVCLPVTTAKAGFLFTHYSAP